jgi:hypothetical protein
VASVFVGCWCVKLEFCQHLMIFVLMQFSVNIQARGDHNQSQHRLPAWPGVHECPAVAYWLHGVSLVLRASAMTVLLASCCLSSNVSLLVSSQAPCTQADSASVGTGPQQRQFLVQRWCAERLPLQVGMWHGEWRAGDSGRSVVDGSSGLFGQARGVLLPEF